MRRPVGRMKASVEKTAPPKQEDVPMEIPNRSRVLEIVNGTAFRYHPRASVGRDITFTIVGKEGSVDIFILVFRVLFLWMLTEFMLMFLRIRG